MTPLIANDGRRPGTEGVALILTNPLGQILTLKELGCKPQIGKCAGMRSIPMETIERRESRAEALWRLVHEELCGLNVELDPAPRGMYWVTPTVAATLYCGRAPALDLPTQGCDEDVTEHRWEDPRAAMTQWLRLGAIDMIRDFLSGIEWIERHACEPVAASLQAHLARAS